jgi:predicted Zn-dependent peptidase
MKLTLLTVVLTALNGWSSDVPFERYKLANGLRVILSQDNAVPVVSVYVIYNVGARSEQKGRTGFAHLFEHMMFQGSKNAPKGMHFQQVEANGGTLNGSTHPDYTDYFEILPSNKLAVPSVPTLMRQLPRS